MKKYPAKNKHLLNYEAINNNKSLKGVLADFDYKVINAVDFSKLFLQRHMAQYTGFNDSCDSSALLGLLINIDTFPPSVPIVAQQVCQ